MSKDQRNKALAIVNSLKAKYGNAIHTGKKVNPIEFTRTGHPMLDYVFGGKGVPRGRIIEMYGNEGSGKTSLCLHIVRQFQKAGELVTWVDGERSFDPKYSKQMGVDVESLVLVEESNGEIIIEMVSDMIRLPEPPSLIVIDSVAAITSGIEVEEGINNTRPALNARMWNKAMRIWNAINKKTTIVLINQIRFGIGGGKGENVAVGGGMGIKFHASVRIRVRKGGWITSNNGKKVIGHEIKMRSDKNKVTGFPHRSGELNFFYDLRDTYVEELITFGKLTGVIEAAGAWTKFGGKSYKGTTGLEAAIKADKKMLKTIEEKIYSGKAVASIDIGGVPAEGEE